MFTYGADYVGFFLKKGVWSWLGSVAWLGFVSCLQFYVEAVVSYWVLVYV